MKAILAITALTATSALFGNTDYSIVDTGQDRCYDDRSEISYPRKGQTFFGQDAQYSGNQPACRDNKDGTVTDLNTSLMWQSDPCEKKTYAEIVAGISRCRTGGYNDWRLPTIKELYSLILFSGIDCDPRGNTGNIPFIDTDYFKFQYGKAEDGDRIIDSQWATSTLYKGKVMHGAEAMFGVNFADGRIKGYPVGSMPGRGAKKFYVIYVRGNNAYGHNDFVDNKDGTVTDRATGLTWMQADSGKGMDWPSALGYAETMDFAGHSDWRLPNAKELQSILDYNRSPTSTRSAAINPVFNCTEIVSEDGQKDYGHYWSSTTHVTPRGGSRAVYLAFGRALGFMNGQWMDVHGAGAQRSDEKSGDESQLPKGHGPQGDAQRINNMVRLVRGGSAELRTAGPAVEKKDLRLHDNSRAGEPPLAGGENGHPPVGKFVQRLDRNGDGKVSASEFDGPSRHFRDFDQNGDGYITEEEAAKARHPQRGRN